MSPSLVFPIHIWMWNHSLGSGKPTIGHNSKENLLSFPRQSSAANSSVVPTPSCWSFQMAWSSAGNHTCYCGFMDVPAKAHADDNISQPFSPTFIVFLHSLVWWSLSLGGKMDTDVPSMPEYLTCLILSTLSSNKSLQSSLSTTTGDFADKDLEYHKQNCLEGMAHHCVCSNKVREVNICRDGGVRSVTEHLWGRSPSSGVFFRNILPHRLQKWGKSCST